MLDHKVDVWLFKRLANVLKVSVPFYIPTISVHEFQFLHILANT